MNLLVTGGCGFIGSNFIRLALSKNEVKRLVNVDKMTYAADFENTKEFENRQEYSHHHFCLTEYEKFWSVCKDNDITDIVHFAAETHVDNSIKGSKVFVQSNVVATHSILETCKDRDIRLHHISTDEVYGEVLGKDRFTENSHYNPKNPYSATKAASDFLVKSYVNTYGTRATISNCSNNYGPNQHDEKLIPTIIRNLLSDELIPVYGQGTNVRDWIYVDDHCEAIWLILKGGKIGETYLVGADAERTNMQTISSICNLMERTVSSSIKFVEDRAGHDFRYAIDGSKLKEELGWKARYTFLDGLSKTITFYKKKYNSP
tara:strand:+ start:6042 stop:6995 length:954 start_codon:yes stop_codon:yes gene_type:complete